MASHDQSIPSWLLSKLTIDDVEKLCRLKDSDKCRSRSNSSSSTITETSSESSKTLSSISSPTIERSIETRNARLASSILSLDEDIPDDIDDSIKALVKPYLSSNPSALGAMEFLVDEDYLEYKANIAAKKASEKKLPKSKEQHLTQK